MMSANDTPIFNLKAVVHETGLKSDTLRAWERRYGLPAPQRTPSGHRLYSQRDIDILKWLIARQQEGMSISRAVHLWHQVADGEVERVSAAAQASKVREVARPDGAARASTLLSNVDELRKRWVNDCLRFDEQAADQTLSTAFAMFGTDTVCLNILQRGLADIGTGWHEGRVTAQQEHFASEAAIRRLEAMVASTPAPTRPGRLLLGCPPDERHTFVLIMLTLLLRRRGFDVIYLGANIPFDHIEETMQTAQPALVILTAQRLVTAARLCEMAHVLHDEGVPIAYGGSPFTRFPEICKFIPGYFLGPTVSASLEAIEQIMVAPQPRAAYQSPSAEYQRDLVHFRSVRSAVESETWRLVSELNLSHRQIADANREIGDTIDAALAFGNIALLNGVFEYIDRRLIDQLQMKRPELDAFLGAYQQTFGLSALPEHTLVSDCLTSLIKADRSLAAFNGQSATRHP